MKKEPKDLTQYHFKLMEAFHNFLQDADEEKLISVWNEVEAHAKSTDDTPEKTLWIRYFHGDTLATDINNIIRDYHNSNRNYLFECMKICCDTAEIEVYFS